MRKKLKIFWIFFSVCITPFEFFNLFSSEIELCAVEIRVSSKFTALNWWIFANLRTNQSENFFFSCSSPARFQKPGGSTKFEIRSQLTISSKAIMTTLASMRDINIFIKLASLPDELKKEVNDFIDFLKAKDTTKTKPAVERKSGLAKGLIKMKPDFDEPLDDFKEYMH